MHSIPRSAAAYSCFPQCNYGENAAIRTVPYLQTSTLFHACHTNCNLLTELPHDWAIQLWATSWLLYHLTELFLFTFLYWNLYFLFTCLLTSLLCTAFHAALQPTVASPNVTTHAKISRKNTAQHYAGLGADPRRNRAAHTIARH